MKKIAIITPGVLPIPAVRGGAAETLIDLFVKQNNENPRYELTVFSIDDNKIEHERTQSKSTKYIYKRRNAFLSLFDGILYFCAKNFFRKRNATTFKNLFNRFFYYISIRKHLKKNDYDLVILENHCAEYLALKPKKLRKKYRNKVIYHSHNKPAHYKYFIKTMAITKAIYSVSEALSDLWKEALSHYDFMSKVDYMVIKNGIDSEVFAPATDAAILAFKKKIKLPQEKLIVLFAGRMTEQKGIFELIDAIKELDDKFHLLIVGDFFYDSKVKSKESIRLQDELQTIMGKYTFTGYVPHSEMSLVYNVADLVVLPSKEFDAAPLTLIEAICCCKPVISTAIGGIPEYSKGKGVLLLESGKGLSKRIAAAINGLMDNPSKLKEMSKLSLEGKLEFNKQEYFERYCQMIDVSLEGKEQ